MVIMAGNFVVEVGIGRSNYKRYCPQVKEGSEEILRKLLRRQEIVYFKVTNC